MSLQFVFRGQVVDATHVQAHSEKAKPRAAVEREPTHGGFLVEGHPPGRLAEAEKAYKEAARGQANTKPWDEASWLRKNALRRVARAYVVPSAADLCRDMALKAGWTHVRVRELIKGAK